MSAGYGEHLFNEIAQDIISSDICVFDAPDLNPNVMIEIGVALTWGIRTLIIREKDWKESPTDISGKTWAAYTDSGRIFNDEDHEEKLISLLEFAILKKRSVS